MRQYEKLSKHFPDARLFVLYTVYLKRNNAIYLFYSLTIWYIEI